MKVEKIMSVDLWHLFLNAFGAVLFGIVIGYFAGVLSGVAPKDEDETENEEPDDFTNN